MTRDDFYVWWDKARFEEPYLSKGIDDADVWVAGYRAGLERAIELCREEEAIYERHQHCGGAGGCEYCIKAIRNELEENQ